MKLNLNIELNPKQVAMYNLFNAGEFTEFLLYGSSRSGKTFLILYWLLVQCIAKRANCLVVRATFTSLVMGMIRQTLPSVLNAIARHNGKSDYKKLIVGHESFAHYNGKDNILTFYNGAYIQFASMHGSSGEESSAYDKVLSTEWAHIFCDEVSEMDYNAIDTLRSRLAQKIDGENIMIFALNPSSKLHWTYRRFFEGKNTDDEPIDDSIRRKMFKMHFGAEDNTQFVAKNYFEQLKTLSRLQRQRFFEGEYADIGAGKIFTKFTFLPRPDVSEITEAIIYTDPSAKDQKTSDFKASALVVRTRDSRLWLWNCHAVQGSTDQMLENMYDLYIKSPIVPRLIAERKQLPLDFDMTYARFQEEKKWSCPLQWDTLNHGDKFQMIEGTLEPLVNKGKFIFCNELKTESGCYEQILDQFVRFTNTKCPSRHDDIPDAVSKAVSFMNYDIVNEVDSQDNDTKTLFYRKGAFTSTNGFIIK